MSASAVAEKVGSRLPRKVAIPVSVLTPLVAGLLAFATAWFRRDARLDRVEIQVGHVDRVICLLEKREGITDVDCEPEKARAER